MNEAASKEISVLPQVQPLQTEHTQKLFEDATPNAHVSWQNRQANPPLILLAAAPINAPEEQLNRRTDRSTTTQFDSQAQSQAQALAQSQRQAQADLSRINHQIENHKAFKKSESYLGRALDLVYKSDANSLARLEAIKTDELRASNEANIALFGQSHKSLSAALDDDDNALSRRAKVNAISGAAVKTSFLLVKGNAGLIGAGTAFALDQMRPGDQASDQMWDGLLGAAKGTATQYLFNKINALNMGISFKAITMDIAGRGLNAGFSRATWLDDTSSFAPLKGIGTTLATTLDPRALAVDGVVLGTSYLGLKGLDMATNDLLQSSPFARTIATGATFGFASGASSETMHQHAENRFSLPNILLAGGVQALTSGIAAIPAGLQNDAIALQALKSPATGLNIGLDKIRPTVPQLSASWLTPAHP